MGEGKQGSRMSITATITLWYVVFLILISMILVTAMLGSHNQQLRNEAEKKLIQVVDEVGDAITADGGDYIFDKRISYYVKDTYISLYDTEGEMLTGRRPRGIEDFPEIDTSKTQILQDINDSEWYIYDTSIRVDGTETYIRGMLNNIVENGRASFELNFIMWILPVIIVSAIIGGYAITKRAFAPVRDIIETTEEIKHDGDLSRRIPLGRSRDEIYKLAESFNSLFDNIEDVVNREKEFTADVSHELRTPLAVIQSQSEFAMEDEEYAPKAVGVINREAHRMTSLIKSLLTIARSDAGRLNPEFGAVDLSMIIREIVENIAQPLDEEDVRFELNIEPGVTAVTDEDMVTRIVTNLINNAVKYGKRPGGRITVSVHKGRGEAVCRVADNGEGIPREDRDKIWNRFYRVETARSGNDSTGLGLAMVDALTKAIGGKVSLIDVGDVSGAVFELRIPLTNEQGGA